MPFAWAAVLRASPQTPVPLSENDAPSTPTVGPALPLALASPVKADNCDPTPVVPGILANKVPVFMESALTALAVIWVAAKFPEASRFTIALGTLASVGGTSHCRFNVPAVFTGEPLTLKSEFGALSPTFVTVPPWLPGKVWPVAKVIRPLLEIDNPVSEGTLVPDPNSRFSVPEGLAVLFPTGSVCQRKVSFKASPMLAKADADRFKGCEFFPAAAVAAPLAARVTAPRRTLAPFTSSLAAGALVPIPTFVPVSKICELATSFAPSNLASALTVPPGVVTAVAL